MTDEISIEHKNTLDTAVRLITRTYDNMNKYITLYRETKDRLSRETANFNVTYAKLKAVEAERDELKGKATLVGIREHKDSEVQKLIDGNRVLTEKLQALKKIARDGKCSCSQWKILSNGFCQYCIKIRQIEELMGSGK